MLYFVRLLTSLQQKLKGFLEQYTVREEHFQKQLEAKDLTVQLAEAKLQHQMELTSRESEKVKLALDKAKEFSDREMQLQVRPCSEMALFGPACFSCLFLLTVMDASELFGHSVVADRPS